MAQNTLRSSKINTPVFQYHATNDPIVPFGQAKQLRNWSCSLAMPVQWKTFDTGHITTVARGNSDRLGVPRRSRQRQAGDNQLLNSN